VAFAVALPAGLVAIVAWFAYRAVVRRRRERALDAHGPGAPAPAD
jgi:flagellar biosynthesis/type III secretory pathway M-ring protein FliF/YscJ